MPIIRVELFEGRPVETKRQLAAELTDVMCRVTGCGRDSVNVVIDDVGKGNWAVGGKLYADLLPD